MTPLTWAARDYHQALPILARQIELAAKIPHGVEELSRRIDALSRGLQQVREATRSPEKALEVAARQLGYRSVRAALHLLPGSAYTPVLTAVRAPSKRLSPQSRSLGRGGGNRALIAAR